MAPTVKPATKPAAAGSKDKKLPAVPESKLKDAKRRLTTRGSLLLRKRIIKTKVSLRKRQNLIRAERYTRTYLKLQKDVIEKAREAKKAGNIYIPERPKIALVIRIRGWVLVSVIVSHRLYNVVTRMQTILQSKQKQTLRGYVIWWFAQPGSCFSVSTKLHRRLRRSCSFSACARLTTLHSWSSTRLHSTCCVLPSRTSPTDIHLWRPFATCSTNADSSRWVVGQWVKIDRY